MILLLTILGIVVYASSCCLVIYALYNAPEGYEDETGFHYGEPLNVRNGNRNEN